jgi:hypothetical protein
MLFDRKSVLAVASCFVVFAACSPSDSSKGPGTSDGAKKGDGGTNADGTPTSGSGGKGSTSTPEDTAPVGKDLSLLFNPMYSAFDGNKHVFTLPAIVQGFAGAKWSARPADAVDLDPDGETGGVLITTRKAGKVLIIARAGKLSGSAWLYITDASPKDWELGENRYHNEIAFPKFDGGIPDGGYQRPDGGYPDGGSNFELPNNLQCSNCHGDGATALDVEHTPQQTAGYSDDQLIGIFTTGKKPKGSMFHTPFPPDLYAQFHTWDATPAERKGLVVYLRSLEPKTQGKLDFMGLRDAFGGGMMMP